MKYCSKCWNPTTRPNVYFDENGVCGACLWEEEKKHINWDERLQELATIAETAKRKAAERGTYDAVLGASGGKDTTFTALYARDKLGLNCLLVNAAPEYMTQSGQHNIDNLVSKGFDCITIRVNPVVQKKLMLDGFRKYGQIRKPCEYPLWASTYTIAKQMNIPLVIQGENAALTQGVRNGMNLDGDASQIYRTGTLGNGIKAIDEFGHLVDEKDILLYRFPDLSDWDGAAIWLNYYVKEWSQYGNAQFAIAHGLKVRTEPLEELGRIHPWSCIDSDFHMVNQMLKYFKFGFGFATDEVSYNIREQRMTRARAFELLKEYDGRCGKQYIKKFCQWLGIEESEFWGTVSKFKKCDPYNRWEEMTKDVIGCPK